jgi:hypothetical protein
MEAILIVLFFVLTFGPLIAYALYTARFGEPRRADKPGRSKRVRGAAA